MRKTQKDLVYEYMQTHKSITPLEALIYDLKKDGIAIITKQKKVKKSNGEDTYVAEYMLESKFWEENEEHIPGY